ncbi:hypothetical protein, partial [Gluconobacter oxydans]
YYRMEFLWRNQKIPSTSKIFRYYIMMAISVKCGAKSNILNAKQAQKDQYYHNMISISDNENELISAVNGIVDSILKYPHVNLVGSREKLRDTIRSDSFVKIFESDIMNQ